MNYPKIGIRPTIDGRWGGVRESLEKQTMGMATAACELIESTLRYPDGSPVQCVISDTTIGGGAEAAKCAEQFSKENVVATLTVTPCWCYGSETFDMDPQTIKAVWGFNGTERPGAVYLAAVMAAYAQKGLPAFSIYGHDVQDMADTEIPADVAEKILRFARSAVSIGWMKNKAYVNLGGVSMGIAGSYCNADLFQKYFGIRAEWVDMTEIVRRITLEIYDKDEYENALKWVKENCKEGFDCNAGKDLPEIITKSKVVPADRDWEFITKMTMVMRDILFGNKKLDEMGWHEEALGKNAIAGGFQGQRNWTDWLPNADFTEAIMASTFDWNGTKMPTPFATENDTLNGVAMISNLAVRFLSQVACSSFLVFSTSWRKADCSCLMLRRTTVMLSLMEIAPLTTPISRSPPHQTSAPAPPGRSAWRLYKRAWTPGPGSKIAPHPSPSVCSSEADTPHHPGQSVF